MHYLHEHWLSLWDWLTKQGASRATAILMGITGWYAVLTSRMTKAMSRQTRAMVQPVLEIDITVEKDEFYPKGSFLMKNIGTQPALIRHMRMTCRRDTVEVFDEYLMYERHLMTPDDMLRFKFDFTEDFAKKGIRGWSPGSCSFYLWVVASDISEDETLTYIKNQYWSTLRVMKGMPWYARKIFIVAFFKHRYYRVVFKIWPSRPKVTKSIIPKPDI